MKKGEIVCFTLGVVVAFGVFFFVSASGRLNADTPSPAGDLFGPPILDKIRQGEEERLPSPVAKRFPYHEILGQVDCQSEFPLNDASGLAAEIGALQTDLVEYLGIPVPNEKINLFLFENNDNYRTFLHDRFPQAPNNRPALYIKDRGPGQLFLQRDENLVTNLRHEMTHAFLNASLRNVPIWLDEGLAKYFETPPGKRGYQNPFLPTVADRAESFFRPVPSLPTLEKLVRIDQMGPAQYRDSWAWIHFLLHYSPETHHLLGYYLQSLRPENQRGIDAKRAAAYQKTSPLTMLLTRYVPDYKKKYRDHFDHWGENSAKVGGPLEKNGSLLKPW